jgi:hypothetical protein
VESRYRIGTKESDVTVASRSDATLLAKESRPFQQMLSYVGALSLHALVSTLKYAEWVHL